MPGPEETAGVVLQAAVRGVFSRWTALHLAVQHGGAPHAAAVADRLLADVTAMALCASRRARPEDYAALVDGALAELWTDVEDGSPAEVVGVIVRMRDAAAAGELGPARREAEKPVGRGVGGSVAATGGGGDGSSSGDGSGSESDGQGGRGDEEMGGGEAAAAAAPAPEVDEDGFVTVARRQTRSTTARIQCGDEK